MSNTLRSVDFVGIDYGSKLAGTTVCAHYQLDGAVQFYQSARKSDADLFLETLLLQLKAEHIFLDAPLSLPGVYTDPANYTDYFYRRGDRELKAMSPMFLGGLTARAMRLAAVWRDQERRVYEVYPGAAARRLGLKELNYKKTQGAIPDVAFKLERELPLAFDPRDLRSWHHVDALLALYSGWRFLREEHEFFGDAAEGGIVV